MKQVYKTPFILSKLASTWLLLAVSIFFSNVSFSIDTHFIKDLRVEGADRTSINWVKHYLDIETPMIISDFDVQDYSEKLLTTGVYKDVEVYFDSKDPKSNQKTLVIKLDEKWTTIPVIRGEFGGGTPLRVLGVYDTHSFGNLWTLGAESRKYGTAEPGYVLWARAPRWKRGKNAIGFEFWRDIRSRDIFHSGSKVGVLKTNTRRIRIVNMFPFDDNGYDEYLKNWQYGYELEQRVEQPANFSDHSSIGTDLEDIGLDLKDEKVTENHFLANITFDNVIRHNSDYHGLRLILKGGPLTIKDEVRNLSKLEVFGYYLLEKEWNFVSHLYISNSTSSSLASQNFLGGLESIRGVPDGYIFGTKAAFVNFETRYVGFRLNNVWFQQVIFSDIGMASQSWKEAENAKIASAGVGLRISFPKIYRLMLRIDYGWSVMGNNTRGFTIGLNQFFQPYKPL